jgi:nucleoside-diphosphate-sugar epimerase
MRRIAVTGSQGFIGVHLVARLKTEGYEVLEISRSTKIDICDWDAVKELPKCDTLIHLAAKTFVPDSFSNPRDFYDFNIRATLNALELAKTWNAKLINMSSYFYGTPQYIPVDELHPIAPHNPYAQTKLISEQLCSGYNRDFNVPVLSFRLFNLYGPGQKGSLLIPEILQQIPSGKVVLKDPRPKRDYIHIHDVVSALMLSITTPFKGAVILNLGTGVSSSINTLVDYMKEECPIAFEVLFTNEHRKGEVLDSVACTKKIEKELGWKPMISLQQGIRTLFKSQE